MTQLGFFVDVSKCSGCKTCAVACKDAHNLPVGMNFRKVHEYAGGNWKQAADGSWTQDVFGYYVSLGCNHCSDPACVKVCPTKAHHKRAEDGLVVIDATKCIGCGLCAQACPYHAPVLDETAHKMRKCDALTACREDFSRSVWKVVLIAPSNSAKSKSYVRNTANLLKSLLCPLLLRHNRIWFWLFLLRLALQEILQVLSTNRVFN